MQIPYYQVNAFTSRIFGGNPAGVCPLGNWLPDSVLQSIAAENNFSETAFFTREKDSFLLRWFTPVMEVDICGHATLAAACVLFSELDYSGEEICFQSRSGCLVARRKGKIIELDFPAWSFVACEASQKLLRGLGTKPKEVLKSHRDYMAVFDTQQEVAGLKPDISELSQLDRLGVNATAPGDDADFVSRFFAPQAGIPEDPVTGSAHCSLIPLWSGRLGKSDLFARQISQRGGELHSRHLGDRVGIGGEARIYCRGKIEIPD